MSVDFDAVRAWIADDPDPETRKQLTDLVEATQEPGEESARALDDLADRFSGMLQFGTAGLRGELGGGPNRMNRAVVIRAAAGLTAFLRDTVGDNFTVVIGCDARYGSEDFARDTAAVVTAAGGHALMLPARKPTPMLAFAVNHLEADAGVMVTASHNPPRDNGYKVYLGARPQAAVYLADTVSQASAAHATAGAPGMAFAGIGTASEDAAHERATHGAGAQIVAPFDSQIASHIARVDSVADVPRAESGWESVDVTEEYLASIAAVRSRLGVSDAPADLRIVHTSMHGVGNDTTLTALEQAGFTRVTPVEAQAQPDPDFPTVTFPNPEEPGALDLAFETAKAVNAQLVIANDPDADRVSIAVPIPDSHGAFRQLTGDEVGLLLGDFIASRTPGTVANSIVSSRALAQAADFHGVPHRTTLTGFKWIARGTDLVFGYEEALGYSVNPQVVRDKDGVSAAVVIAHLVAELHAQGRTVDDELKRIRVRDGIFLTAPYTIRVTNLKHIDKMLDRLASAPPTDLGGSAVTEVVDLSQGSESLPGTPGFALLTESGDRVVIRPSGTEPKLKCYLEAVETADESTYPQALAEARAKLDRITADLAEFLQ